MSYQLKVSETAYQEMDDAYDYYEKQSTGLGDRFLKSVEDTFFKLSQAPHFYRFIPHDNNIGDVKVNIFPFVIIFQIVENTVFILRVFNTNRNPESLKDL